MRGNPSANACVGRSGDRPATYLASAATTSDGSTSWPVWLLHEFFVYVMAAAISVSDSLPCHAGIAPLRRPCSTVRICAFLSASSTVGDLSSGLTGPAPVPSGLWQTAQLARYTFSPRAISGAISHTFFGSSAAAASAFFWV